MERAQCGQQGGGTRQTPTSLLPPGWTGVDPSIRRDTRLDTSISDINPSPGRPWWAGSLSCGKCARGGPPRGRAGASDQPSTPAHTGQEGLQPLAQRDTPQDGFRLALGPAQLRAGCPWEESSCSAHGGQGYPKQPFPRKASERGGCPRDRVGTRQRAWPRGTFLSRHTPTQPPSWSSHPV